MKRLLIAIVLTTLAGCSTEQLKTTGVDFQQQAENIETIQASTSYQTSQDSASSKKIVSDQQAINVQQESLLPRIARYIKQGVASWYGPGFHGKKTATGEIFDMNAMTAAHKTLPIPSYAQVTNLENHRSIIVRINDRGPFTGNREMDLSYAAAKNLDMAQDGIGSIEIKSISPSQALPEIQQIAAALEQHVYLQIGSFGSVEKAMSLRNKIAASNLPEPDIRSSTYKRSTLYKVQIGPISSTETANQLNQQLTEIGITDTQFVTESKQSQRSHATM
ncbi:MAG: septal ring lytic transglycosylase RlpA family protein [Methylococcales bacterium]